MNYRLYGKVARRLVKIQKLIHETSMLMLDLDGGLHIDLNVIEDEVINIYEVMDERKDRGDYHVD